MTSEKNNFLSIVCPVYNEEGNVQPLVENIHNHCSSRAFELIVVDDGSTDGTVQELDSLRVKFKELNVLRLKRNFGQTAALAAGIDHAKGDVIVTIDGDGQNDPSDIPKLLEKINAGYDVVSGWRKNRKDSFFSRKLPSWMANWLISWVTGVHLHDYGCTLKAYRRPIISNLQMAGEMHRFLPAWCVWHGGQDGEIGGQQFSRHRGEAKYRHA